MKTRYIDLIEQTFDFPKDEFAIDDDKLLWNGLRLMDILEKHGTPLRITYLPKIGEKIDLARECFAKAIKDHGYTGSYEYFYCTKSNHFSYVIDKVLANNTMGTLIVLSIGLFAVAIWEVMFGWIRTRVFSETSQKIDVELGARVFRHMLALPLSYFEERRVGDSVTRVRQIETIREFLTNASLSVLVDPIFTLVFLVAMAFYSPGLTIIVILSLIAYAAISLVVTGPMRAATASLISCASTARCRSSSRCCSE